MPIVPLYGHRLLREQLRRAAEHDTLPASLLLHGPRGVGKQRLALWLAQALLCPEAGERPCGRCQSCRYAGELGHPDLQWFFPRPRKEADATPEEVRSDYADAIAERVASHGLYAPTLGTEGIFVAAVRAIVRSAALSPALGRRKVFVVGDAERMVPQEGAEAAANAFLKLLEEPPADTTLILTSSEPGALLPTIRSRVIAVRVGPLSDADVREFLRDPAVREALDGSESVPSSDEERVRAAAGIPGLLLTGAARMEALSQARRLLSAAASGSGADRYRLAFAQGGSRARGAFTDALDALTIVLHERVEEGVRRSDRDGALKAARAVEVVEGAKALAQGNVSPQLVSASLLRELGEILR